MSGLWRFLNLFSNSGPVCGGGIRDGRKALQRRKEGRNAECRRLDLNRANFSSLSLGKEDLCIICCLHARALTHTTSDTVGFDRIPTAGLMRVICIALDVSLSLSYHAIY